MGPKVRSLQAGEIAWLSVGPAIVDMSDITSDALVQISK